MEPVGRKSGVVTQNPLPKALEAVRVVVADVIERARDRVGELELVDLPTRALAPQRTLELAATELPHGTSERRRVDALDVDHFVLHRRLDCRRQRMQRLRRLLAVHGEMW